MLKPLVFALSIFFAMSLSGQNQYLTTAIDGFSKKKTSYLTLNDGTEIEGTIKKIKRAKWLFEEIHLILEDGKKEKISADKIKSMYFPQSGMDKFGKFMDKGSDATAWSANNDLNQEKLKDGYAYFESTDCYYKKKKSKVLLLQLLNPSFAGKVKVFHDPGASEGGGMKIGGLKVTKDFDKSYYIKTGDDPAYKLKKKNYKDQAGEIFSGCSDFLNSIKDDLNWKKIGETLYNYSKECF